MVRGTAIPNHSNASRSISMNTYRQIYEQYHGSIPTDQTGQTYDIHHIDGNHSNNDITNLNAVSLQEHFDIHYSQQDWLACQLISLRLGLSPEERFELSSKAQQKRVTNGEHHFSDSKWQSDNQLNRVAKGTHPFVGGEIQRETNRRLVAEGKHIFQGEAGVSCRRVREGTHHFLGERNPMHAKVADGTHPWLGGEQQKRIAQRRVADGTHHFLGSEINRKRIEDGSLPETSRRTAQRRVADGTHHFLNPTERTCPHCGFVGKGGIMIKWHFDNCKVIKDRIPQIKITCPHCNKTGGQTNMKRYHFDNCKSKL